MLSVRGLNQFYGESHTLWDLDLDVQAGSCTCLMGRNGVGKTTLLKCLMGLLPLRSGRITLESHVLSALPAERRAPLGVGYVPQGREIFPRLTVAENLRIGLTAVPTRAAERALEEVFTLFPVLARMRRRRGGDLSGGQQQQLAIGRALVIRPRLLILDEPTEGIQPNVVHEIGETIVSLNRERGITILLVGQNLAFMQRIGDTFWIMDKGRAVANGPMSGLSEALVRQYLTV